MEACPAGLKMVSKKLIKTSGATQENSIQTVTYYYFSCTPFSFRYYFHFLFHHFACGYLIYVPKMFCYISISYYTPANFVFLANTAAPARSLTRSLLVIAAQLRIQNARMSDDIFDLHKSLSQFDAQVRFNDCLLSHKGSMCTCLVAYYFVSIS